MSNRPKTLTGLELKKPATLESALLIADKVWRETFGKKPMTTNEQLRADRLAKRGGRRGNSKPHSR